MAHMGVEPQILRIPGSGAGFISSAACAGGRSEPAAIWDMLIQPRAHQALHHDGELGALEYIKPERHESN